MKTSTPLECLNKFREDDVITEVLKSIHLKSVVFSRSELRAPWGFSIPEQEWAGFHIVTRGKCWLRFGEDEDAVALGEGDLAILTRGGEHVLADNPGTPPKSLDISLVREMVDESRTYRIEGNGPVTELICGGFFFSDQKLNPLLSTLPRLIHTRGGRSQAAPWLRMTWRYILEELKANQPGGESVITRLSDILFIQAVRAFLASTEGARLGWLRALKDPQIGFALNLIHSQPESAWTVQSLGVRVGMSRSSFADRFHSIVGESPMQYLSRWRLHTAAVQLRTTTAKLSQIAARAGYDSEFSFGRAFKRATGISPGAYRKAAGKRGDELQ